MVSFEWRMVSSRSFSAAGGDDQLDTRVYVGGCLLDNFNYHNVVLLQQVGYSNYLRISYSSACLLHWLFRLHITMLRHLY